MHHRPPPVFQCEYCGKTKERRMCRYKDGRTTSYDMTNRFCSKECGWKGRKWRPISETGYLTEAGYRKVSLRGGGKELMHRRVMAKILGRALKPGESVHHKDGHRDNNKPNNLELWSKRQPAGQRVIDKITFAIEMLRTYPEFAQAAGVTKFELGHETIISAQAAVDETR